MVRTLGRWVGSLTALTCGAVLVWSAGAQAIYLDPDQNITLRARIYSQMGIRAENSDDADAPVARRDTVPTAKVGQIIQHRNFYNPELDAKLTPYVSWMKGSAFDWLAPDDLRFRVAAWGFYDGIYDYGTSQFGRVARDINSNFGNYSRGVCSQGPDAGKVCSSNAECASPGKCKPAGAWFMEGPTLNIPADGFVDSVDQLLPGAELKNPREIYAQQRRINELYVGYTKGPLFLRLGKQAISWGESDTIALLDQTNPFDVTLGAPGLFQDIDEARLPLWTARASLNLFDTLGPLSSGFVEAYWVPGDLDVNTGILPILTASPYSPRGRNPQFSSGFPDETFQFILFDHIPKKNFESSRYGFRFQTVLNRAYTLQAWIYTHYPQAPVPRHASPVVVRPGTQGARTIQPLCGPFSQQGCSPIFLVETVHDLTTVYGLAATFFLEPLDGIVRINGQYFENEPGFIPQLNLNIRCLRQSDANDPNKGPCTAEDVRRDSSLPPAGPVTDPGSVPKADIIRWELGFDRFFFFRPLNPTNSFILSASQVGQWNMDETDRKDFRFGGQRKPGKDILGKDPTPADFVQLKPVEAFGQITLLTDYMHGRLSPQMTWIQNVRGTYAIHPQVTYRWSDSLIFKVDFVHIGGEYQSLGYFRDRDQVSVRATYQLN